MKNQGAATLIAAALVLFLTCAGGAQAFADTPVFVPGSGNASAQVVSLPLALAGESEGVNQGLSIAAYANDEGQAESQTLVPGLLGLLPGLFPASVGSIQAESTSTADTKTQSVAGTDGAGAGVEDVAASKSTGMASTSLATLKVANVLSVVGGQSSALSSIIGGTTRHSESTSQIASVSLLGGLVVLNGLRWNSVESTGATSTAASTFSVAAVDVSGVTLPVSVDSLSNVFNEVNAVLAPTGFHISLPHMSVGSGGSIQETPLSIGIDNTALGQKVVGPVVSALQPLRTKIFDALTGLTSSAGDVDLVAELVLGIAGGQGVLDVDLGGTYAATNGTAVANPLTTSSPSQNLGSASLPGPLLPGSPFSSSPSFDGGNPGVAAGVAGGSSTPAGSVNPVKALAAEEIGRSSVCRSTTVGGCRSFAVVPLTVVLVAAAISLLGAEFAFHRRGRRRHGAPFATERTA
jgi:hypothetical protein